MSVENRSVRPRASTVDTGGRNHFGRMCRKELLTVNLARETRADTEYWLDAATVTAREERSAWTVELDFFGKTMEFKVDTGAHVTVLKEIDLKRFQDDCLCLRLTFHNISILQAGKSTRSENLWRR